MTDLAGSGTVLIDEDVKKLLAVGLLGAAVVGGVTVVAQTRAVATPEGRVCVRLADLCGRESSSSALDSCVSDMKQTRKLAGDASFERSTKCIDESSSCAAAAGCMMGGVGVGALGEMMKGFGTAVSK